MPDVPVSQRESAPAAHADRHRRTIEDGRADIAAGRILTPECLDEWIATLGTAYEQPAPQSRR